MPAKYDLHAKVFPLIASGKVGFLAPSRSVDCVIAVFQQFGVAEAQKYILSNIQGLSTNDFSASHYNSSWKIVWDVYGKQIDGINWYIKFFVEPDSDGQDYLAEVSFHPLEEKLKLENGEVLIGEENALR